MTRVCHFTAGQDSALADRRGKDTFAASPELSQQGHARSVGRLFGARAAAGVAIAPESRRCDATPRRNPAAVAMATIHRTYARSRSTDVPSRFTLSPERGFGIRTDIQGMTRMTFFVSRRKLVLAPDSAKRTRTRSPRPRCTACTPQAAVTTSAVRAAAAIAMSLPAPTGSWNAFMSAGFVARYAKTFTTSNAPWPQPCANRTHLLTEAPQVLCRSYTGCGSRLRAA